MGKGCSMKILHVVLTVAAIAAAGKGAAHEFWIDAAAYVVSPGETVEAQLRVGEAYRGSPQA
jgi:uncharacterized GH25 family protein